MMLRRWLMACVVALAVAAPVARAKDECPNPCEQSCVSGGCNNVVKTVLHWLHLDSVVADCEEEDAQVMDGQEEQSCDPEVFHPQGRLQIQILVTPCPWAQLGQFQIFHMVRAGACQVSPRNASPIVEDDLGFSEGPEKKCCCAKDCKCEGECKCGKGSGNKCCCADSCKCEGKCSCGKQTTENCTRCPRCTKERCCTNDGECQSYRGDASGAMPCPAPRMPACGTGGMPLPGCPLCPPGMMAPGMPCFPPMAAPVPMPTPCMPLTGSGPIGAAAPMMSPPPCMPCPMGPMCVMACPPCMAQMGPIQQCMKACVRGGKVCLEMPESDSLKVSSEDLDVKLADGHQWSLHVTEDGKISVHCDEDNSDCCFNAQCERVCVEQGKHVLVLEGCASVKYRWKDGKSSGSVEAERVCFDVTTGSLQVESCCKTQRKTVTSPIKRVEYIPVPMPFPTER